MTLATAAPASSVRHYLAHSPWRRTGRGLALLLASLLFVAYVLGPIAWLVSSSFQSEHEIIAKPPHWIPQAPTLQNFAAIFAAKEKTVTYETRKSADPSTGGFIPSTASNLLPAMLNSFIVASAVVVLNLLVGVGADRIQSGDQTLRRRRGRGKRFRPRDQEQGVHRAAWPIGLRQIDDTEHDRRP